MKLITILMKRGLVIFLLAGIAVLSFQCRKESGGAPAASKNQVISVTSADPITSTLQGNVVDENGLPASGVTITVNTTIVTTDSIGYFKIPNASLDKKASLVTAIKTGYFKAYRTFCATSGTNQVFIKLIKRALVGTVNSSAGGLVTLPNGAKILLPAGGVVLASDSVTYSGTINVYTAYIDPTDVDIRKLVPGSFMANNINGNRVPLTSYGMLEVELESSAGEQLQIAAGHTATLTAPIPSSLQSSAPTSMSLWYLNDQTGLWQEEGTAVKSGNNYVGTVKHFTYWNTGYSPLNGVMFSATFQTASGTPLENMEITVSALGGSGVAFGYTDSKGQVSGLVAADTALFIQASDQCNNVVLSKNVPAQSVDFNIGTVALSVTTPNLYTVSGKLVDCNNVAVSNGSAEILSTGMWQDVSCDNAGNFSTTFLECPISSGNNFTSLQIVGEDDNAHQQGNAVTILVTSTTITAGNIIACGTSIGYNISVEGKLVDCNNAAVPVGYATVTYNGVTQIVACDNTGNFSAEIFYNPDTLHICQVSGLDATAGKQGSPANFTLGSLLSNNIANVGNIVACGSTVNSSMSYTIDGSTNVLFDPMSYLQAYSQIDLDSIAIPAISAPDIFISSFFNFDPANYAPQGIEFDFFNSTSTTGTFTLNRLYIDGYGYVTLILPFNVILTNFPAAVGNNYTGSFSGQFKDAANVIHTVSCSFNEARTN